MYLRIQLSFFPCTLCRNNVEGMIFKNKIRILQVKQIKFELNFKIGSKFSSKCLTCVSNKKRCNLIEHGLMYLIRLFRNGLLMKLIRPTTRQRRRCQRHHLHRRRPRRGSAAMADEHDGDAKLQSFLQWAADLGVSDSLPCPPRRRSCLGESLIVSHFPGAGG